MSAFLFHTQTVALLLNFTPAILSRDVNKVVIENQQAWVPDLRLISGLKGTLIRGCMTTDDVYSSSHESGAKTSLTSIDPQMTTVGFSISLQLVNLKP